MIRLRSLTTALASILLLASIASTANADDRALRRQLEEMRNETRVALVIGNADYASSPLKNPVNDARLMAKTLKALGFDVIELVNANQKQMKMAVDQFGQKIRNGGVALFYYAGHGMQVEGRNYLIPVGANITAENEVEYEGMDSGRILVKMENAGTRVNIVMLDACRNNPFARSFRSSSTGLASVDAPQGSFIAYATAPGSVAADGEGSNGLFTEQLVQALSVEGQSIENVFKQVRSGVMAQTGKKQIPWTASSMTGEFYFRLPSVTTTVTPSAPPVTPSTPSVTPSTPSKIDLLAPTGGAGFDLGDLQQRAAQVEANKKAWASRLAEMQAAFAQVEQFEQSGALPNDKKIAWERFAAAFAEDNPYSSEDETLRAKAGQRIGHWEGQAAQVAMARPQAPAQPQSAEYRDNGDGTVTARSGLVWQQGGDGRKRDWGAAMAYCDGLTLGEHTDWRLPTKKELASLVDESQGRPTINQRFFPGTQSDYYWSSTTRSGFPSGAWDVYFGTGRVGNHDDTVFSYVRCVRDGQAPTQQSTQPQQQTVKYRDNGNGTVTAGSLVWQQRDDGQERAWEAALAYCEGLTLGGHSDWRLPSKEELASLVDKSQGKPTIGQRLFPGTGATYYWTSTPFVSDTSYAWLVHFGTGSVESYGKAIKFSVRCVRG